MGKLTSTFFIAFIISLSILCCRKDTMISDPELEQLIKTADKEKSNSNDVRVVRYVESKYQSTTDPTIKLRYLDAGLQFCTQHKMDMEASSFLSQIISEDYTSPKTPSRLLSLINYYNTHGKEFPADILGLSLVKNFPKAKESGELKGKINLKEEAVPGMITSLKALSIDTTAAFGINGVKAIEYMEACDAYALGNPNSPEAPEMLFSAAEMARSARNISRSLFLYDKLIQKYPQSKRVPSALFVKGFILENEVKDINGARLAYQTFLAKFPDNLLAKDVKFLLENLGKTGEELMKSIGR